MFFSFPFLSFRFVLFIFLFYIPTVCRCNVLLLLLLYCIVLYCIARTIVVNPFSCVGRMYAFICLWGIYYHWFIKRIWFGMLTIPVCFINFFSLIPWVSNSRYSDSREGIYNLINHLRYLLSCCDWWLKSFQAQICCTKQKKKK